MIVEEGGGAEGARSSETVKKEVSWEGEDEEAEEEEEEIEGRGSILVRWMVVLRCQ